MALTFRTAVAGDIADLVGLVQSAYRGDESRKGWTTEAELLDGQRTDVAEVAGVIASEGSRMIVAERDGTTVGCCRLTRQDDGSAHLGMLAVRPEVQDGGVGRALVAEAEGIAAGEWGAGLMRMTVIRQRIELIAWYERLGYRRTGETEPFPYGRVRFGVPKVPDLEFVVLGKPLP